jgi:predicted phage-related endonuclease
LVYNVDHDLEFGEVIAVLPDDKLLIKWDTEHYNQARYEKSKSLYGNVTIYEPKVMNAEGILPEAEAKKQFSLLEKEYKVVEKKIKNKLKEAAKLITEANSLAEDVNAGSLANMYDAIDPLYAAMDSSGWNTSSFSC